MTAYAGRLEARITVPVGGWAVSVSTSAPAGPATATIAAGSYYVSDLLTAFAAALTAAVGGVWSVVQSTIEMTATVKTTITLVTNTYSITWTSTDLRDVLGFTGNLVSVGSATSTNQAIGVWLPDCPKFTPYGDNVWDRVSDLRASIAPRGGVKEIVGNTYDCLENVRWEMVSNAKAVGLDIIGSWQHFWSAIKTNRYSYIAAGDYVKLFWNSTLSSPSNVVKLVAPSTSKLEQVSRGWTGLYRVEIPMLVKVS